MRETWKVDVTTYQNLPSLKNEKKLQNDNKESMKHSR